MNGKDAIIAGIKEKADREAAALVSVACAERDELVARTTADEERNRAAVLESAREKAQAVLSRRATLCALDARKAELAAKQQAIDAAYDEALKKIYNMTDHIYREYIGGLLEKYAEDGDHVIVAERDSKRLHAEWLADVSAKCGKRLVLDSERHNGKGGVILSGNKCDKNLTLDTMLKSLREKYLTAVADRLFGNRSK